MSIAVVIPAYNAERYIAETLESVLTQTVPVDEILVVDDGSTDATASIAERYAPKVRVFRRANSKAAASRNFAVAEAKSEWVAFLDADDVWFPEKIERQMQELRFNPDADLCYTAMVELVHDGESVKTGNLMPAPPPSDIRHWLSFRCAFLPSSVVVRRSALLKVGGFNASLRYGCEDYDLWFRFCNAGTKFIACPEPLVSYRRHGSNTALSLEWFKEYTGVYRDQNLPYLSLYDRWITWNKLYSQSAYGTAWHLYRARDARCVVMMALSIFRFPLSRGPKYISLAKFIAAGMKGRFRTNAATTSSLD
jgi:glycosyltransferase involved in cell wall biosynthesis